MKPLSAQEASFFLDSGTIGVTQMNDLRHLQANVFTIQLLKRFTLFHLLTWVAQAVEASHLARQKQM